MESELPLEGKVAIVTGSSKSTGIGAATARILAKQGAKIVIHYNGNETPAQQVVTTLKQDYGVEAISVKADALSSDFGQSIVDATLAAFKSSRIDILVSCAGTIVISQGLQDVTSESWDQAFRVNVRAAFLLIQASIPYMQEGGRIVNIGSIAARMGHKMLPVFSASKAALTAMSVSLAEELGPKEITINVVAPGPIATDAGGSDPSLMAPIAQKMFNNGHIKRVGVPEEVAGAISWLVSPSAGFVTGQLIPVDGGIGWP